MTTCICVYVCSNCEHEVKAKMGSTECITHRVLNPFPVLFEKDGACAFDL